MRIVSLLASGTEIVCGLGASEQLVGRSHECDNPPWVAKLPVCTRPAFDISMPSGKIDAEVRRRIEAAEPLYHVDTDLINSLKPDLLITQEHCAVCAVTPADVARSGCVVASQVVALRAGNIQGIFDGICSIGQAVGREQDAANLVDTMFRRIRHVHGAVQNRRAADIVVLEWIDPVFAMGNWGPELVRAANGRLMLGERGEHSTAIDWQRVRDADPEWLVIAPCGFGLDRTINESTILESLPGWSQLRAVREGKVALADGNRYFNRSGTTIVETVEILAEILHGFPAGHEGKAWLNYSRLREELIVRKLHADACGLKRSTYIDPITGYDVFTSDYLVERGYCCGNGCRHCPFPPTASSSSSSFRPAVEPATTSNLR
jgi:iron complex transport system substrate-binding protein